MFHRMVLLFVIEMPRVGSTISCQGVFLSATVQKYIRQRVRVVFMVGKSKVIQGYASPGPYLKKK